MQCDQRSACYWRCPASVYSTSRMTTVLQQRL